jgi:hypothetical protein
MLRRNKVQADEDGPAWSGPLMKVLVRRNSAPAAMRAGRVVV